MPTALGHYRILTGLGAGRMGDVYPGIDTRLNRSRHQETAPGTDADDGNSALWTAAVEPRFDVVRSAPQFGEMLGRHGLWNEP